MKGPLAGLSVLDLSKTLAGPFCAMTLGDMGADVIKVEEPTAGDETRQWAPYWEGESCFYLAINRNKRNIAVNLKHPDGVAVVKQLAAKADVLIESFRTGTSEKMGLGYNDVKALNPRLIYCGISGFGRSGPLSRKGGYDLMVQAYSGLMSLTGEPDRTPVRVGFSLVDITCGWIAYGGIMTALYQREKTGRGQYVEASLLEGMVSAASYHIVNYLATGNIPGPLGQGHPSLTPYQMFPTRDGRVMLGAANDGLWQKFCAVANRQDLAADPRFRTNLDRVNNRQALIAILEPLFKTRTTQEWVELLEAAAIPNAPVNNIADLVHDDQVAHRNMIADIPHPTITGLRAPASPLKLADGPSSIRRHPPGKGEHTETILRELGYSSDAIIRLEACGAVARMKTSPHPGDEEDNLCAR
jgi:crotonobetainyl-CoA:carnitine CoA-transferase CaiB-like acyl-CoA transferase